MFGIRQLIKGALSATLPPRRMLVRGPAQRPGMPPADEIALTFDDGPHPEHTPRLLDALAEAGIVGTFFIVGREAERSPDLVRRIVADGHDVGNHTWTHSEPSQTSAAMFLDEIRRTRRLLEDLAGRDCRLVRPPKGKLTVSKTLGLWRMQQSIVLWNVDPRDYAMQSAGEMATWCSNYRSGCGDIVLLHDNRPLAATAVRLLAESAFRECSGVGNRIVARFVTISDWLARRDERRGSLVTSMDLTPLSGPTRGIDVAQEKS